MATIEEVLSEWKQDAIVDETKINRELLKTPMLHAKYVDYFVYFKVKLANAEKKHNKMAWVKRRYFRGEFDAAELQKYGWEQWQGLKPSSGELNQLLEMDSDMNDLAEMVAGYKTAVATTEYIMKSIGGRDYVLKSLIDYNKFVSGG